MSAQNGPADPAVIEQRMLENVERVLRGSGDVLPGSVAALCAGLAQAAPRPQRAFEQRLEDDLVARLQATAAPSRVDTRPPGLRVWFAASFPRRLAPSFVAAAAVVLMIGVAGPALAQNVLTFVAPRQVSSLPAPVQVTTEPPPAAPRQTPLDEIERQAGFRLLVPTWLPGGCTLQEHFFQPGPQTVKLNYTCVSITLQAGSTVQAPMVAPGAVEEVTVAGRPALYVDGAWVSIAGRDSPPTWSREMGQQVILERDGLVVDLMKSAGSSKQDLLAIAAALQPRR